MGRLDVMDNLLADPHLQVIQVVGGLRPENVVMTLLVATICAIGIFLVYRFFNRSVLYSENFNVLIVMLCVVTSFIIITIGTNIVLTLGMVGALSIVRFRAAVKDPLDVGFLFWGVAAGLTAGAQLFWVALLGTAFVAILYIGFTTIRFERRAFLLIVRYSNEAESAVAVHLDKFKHKLKNKTISGDFTELTLEVKVSRNNTTFLDPLKETDNVDNVVLVEYTGDYA
ncbi:MAG: DUF4956 domain-containing protein [Defluviitaleaceae bacterium]|nr:DUF4956 domain-containing protein [Defluviitaleaceae bacterium]MCL2263018.1 DUF4956 domain-containing protein [Defluviitaleaceae bacterium]